MRVVRLLSPDGDAAALTAVNERLHAQRPGYALEFTGPVRSLPAAGTSRIAFVHASDARAHATLGATRAEIGLGDAIALRAGSAVELDAPLAFVVVSVPDAFDDAVPGFLRPDADPRLRDAPGGCATESDAYRRVMLTWSSANGPYLSHAVNCHRVRMVDSFSHYHPIDGGFEELYLVHDVRPGGRLLWSPDVARIESPASVDRATALTLVRSTSLVAGDLVFIPRGTMHRAVGGVLAHVVTIPGFVPAREIGVDHHLRAIDERLGLVGDEALPYHVAASLAPMVR
ncbi:MAG: hypothetical protein HZB39_08610 [Planctomycetes bacterium]|nr:hypothetical protein [Planctomycetota bacterium]